MILYNVTINIHESVHDQWMRWMQEKHINDVLSTGKFSSARMVKVLIEEEMGGTTYSIQYCTDSKETLQKYYIIEQVEIMAFIEAIAINAKTVDYMSILSSKDVVIEAPKSSIIMP